MHELSIALNIIEIIKQSVPEQELGSVETVKLKIGEFSNVVVDSLLFSLEVITADTYLRNIKYEIDKIPFKVKCNDCKVEFTNKYGIVICPNCESKNTQIISGTELKVTEIELKELIYERNNS
jgi:hydrogenase nickel incorporation protein HypA/HybF